MSLRGTPPLCVVFVSSCLACSASPPASPSSVELDTTPGSERRRGGREGEEGEREERERGRRGREGEEGEREERERGRRGREKSERERKDVSLSW